jgi:hypothetical protein
MAHFDGRDARRPPGSTITSDSEPVDNTRMGCVAAIGGAAGSCQPMAKPIPKSTTVRGGSASGPHVRSVAK